MSEDLIPEISHARGREAIHRLINSHFGNADGARCRIPADRENDDDLVALDYAMQCEEKIARLESENERLREALESIRCNVAYEINVGGGIFSKKELEQIDAALALAEKGQQKQVACGAKDGRRARTGGYSAACIKPKGHDGKHEDHTGCWWV